ncbi:inositol monophosphatase family protein [Candidatus Omnitrophota bacterium]
MADLKKIHTFTQELSLNAGNFLKKNLGKIKKISYKGRMNLVTDIDTRCEKLILKRILDRFPDHKILSEEAGKVGSGDSEFLWLIDPIDGTTNYAHSFPFYCVSIGLSTNGNMVLGAIYDPARNELFSAYKNGGAFLNRKRIHVSRVKKLERSLLTTGFPYKFGTKMRRNITNFSNFMLKCQAVRRPGSAALDLCYVAVGRFEGFWELDLRPWDTAAGAIIVEEAGGRVTTFDGKRFDPFKKEILATNNLIHNQMMKVVV